MQVPGWLVIAVLLCMGGLVRAQTGATSSEKQDWEQRMAARRAKLQSENGPGTDAALRDQLLKMGDEDQAARGLANGKPIDPKKLKLAPDLDKIDARLTAELKQIVAAHGWPAISLVGMEASNAAMLILIHSADHAWQRELLPTLEQLAAMDKIDGSALALVVDKELLAAGKPQRFGTQFKFVGDQMQMYAVEDPSGLGARRAQMLLPPMDVYEQLMTGTYHKKLLPGVAAPEPAGPVK